MSLQLFKTCMKQLLKNSYLWGWGFFFMTFWLITGAYLFSRQLPSNMPYEGYLSYTASWFSMILVFSFSILSVGIVGDVYHASISLRYLTKYTRLNSKKYYLTNVLSYMTFASIFAALLVLVTIAMFSHRFEAFLAPKFPLELSMITLLSILFIYTFSMFEAFIALALRKPKAVRFLSYLSFMLSYPLLFFQLYVGSRILVISPFNAMNSLLYHYYSGLQIPEGALISPMASPSLNPMECWLSTTIWTIGLSTLTIQLIKRQRGISIEELRQI